MDRIERVEDQDRLIIKNSIKYLDALAQTKQLKAPTLKSLYRTKCRLMELRRHIFLPQQKPYQRCQRCFMNFSEGNTKYEVRPIKLSIFAKKVISKQKNGAALTKYQRKYYKELLKKFPNGFHKQNKLVLTCNYCHKEKELWMDKPKAAEPPVKRAATPARKKKKPKKKDKLCGLNASFVSLSSKKKTKASDVNHNQSVFMVPEKNNANTSVSMTNARVFQTSDFIPLEPNAKKKQTIKFSKKQPVLEGVSKAKEKLRKKKLGNLSNILKQANENKGKPTSKLKQFLSGL